MRCSKKKRDERGYLPQSVSTVDDAVGTGHEGGTIRGKVDGKVVEVIDRAETLLGGLVNPDTLLGVESRDTVEGGVHVAGGDGVDADAVSCPLRSQRLGQLNDTGLGGIVAALLLWVVDDASGHGSNEDDGTTIARLDHLTANGLGDEEVAVDVDVDESSEHLGVVGLGLDVGAVTISLALHSFRFFFFRMLDNGVTYSAIPAELTRTSILP